MSQESYITLSADARVEGEFIDRKSRFIAELIACPSAGVAEAQLQRMRATHYDARHHVPAYILSDGTKKASDDGEPSRTAGLPTLEVLEGAGLKDVSCVVVRYFGGTLLGPGGLIRAYSEATRRAIETARVQGVLVEMCEQVRVDLTISYAQFDYVKSRASIHYGTFLSPEFGADIRCSVQFLKGQEQAFVADMSEYLKGTTSIVVSDSFFGPKTVES